MNDDLKAWLEKTADWPAAPPHPDARVIERKNGGGLDLVLELIPTDRPFTVLEVGSEFGASARAWLRVSPQVTVVSVDQWPENYWLPPRWKDLAPFVRSPNGMKRLFQKYCWEFRDRLYPVRGNSPDRLVELFEQGFRPDLMYIDGDHVHDGVFQDLAVAHALWPEAIMTGDDWQYRPDHPKYEGMELPVQYAVKRFAMHRGYDIETRGTTWLMHFDRKPGFAAPPARSVYGLVEQIRALDSKVSKLTDLPSAGTGQDAAPVDNGMSTFDRKLRKLKRDPVRFVLDAPMIRRFRE